MPAQIEIYEQMCALSSRMVEAARASDWERLIDLERSVDGLRAALVKDTGDAAGRGESARRRELIQRILRDDAEVRRHTEPWMEQVRRFLTGSAHSIGSAHGTGH